MKKKMIDEDPDLISFFEYIMNKKPRLRPTTKEIHQRFLTSLMPRVIERKRKEKQEKSSEKPNEEETSNSPRQGEKEEEKSISNEDELEYTDKEYSYFNTVASPVIPGLYLGSRVVNFKSLKKNLQITHIVNCTTKPNISPDEFEYLHLESLEDDLVQNILLFLPRTLRFIHDALQNNGTVYVYSDRGVSRSSAIVIAYLMESQTMSYYDAFLFTKSQR